MVSLWKGFTPYYLRVGPHTVLTFIFFEQVSREAMVAVMVIADGFSRLTTSSPAE